MYVINKKWNLNKLKFELKQVKREENKLTEYGRIMFAIDRHIYLLKDLIREKQQREK